MSITDTAEVLNQAYDALSDLANTLASASDPVATGANLARDLVIDRYRLTRAYPGDDYPETVDVVALRGPIVVTVEDLPTGTDVRITAHGYGHTLWNDLESPALARWVVRTVAAAFAGDSGGAPVTMCVATWPIRYTEDETFSLPFCSRECALLAFEDGETRPAGLSLRDDDHYEFDETCSNCGRMIPASA